MDQKTTDGLELAQEVDLGADKGTLANTRNETATPLINTANAVVKQSCKKHGAGSEKKKKSSKTSKKSISSVNSDSDSSPSSSSSSDSDADDDETAMTSTSSESEVVRKSSKRKGKSNSKTRNQKQKSKKKLVVESSDDGSSSSSSCSESSSDVDSDEIPTKKAKSKSYRAKGKKAAKKSGKGSDSSDGEGEDDANAALLRQISKLTLNKKTKLSDPGLDSLQRLLSGKPLRDSSKKSKKGKKSKKAAAASKVAFKRVDQLWDNDIHDYKLTETADRQEDDKFDQYIFTVRRKFDWEHKYQETTVDIRSKPLKEVLSHIIGGVKSISLHVDVPKLDPNMLFLYLEEMRTYLKELKAARKTEKGKKAVKTAGVKAAHLKIMVKYLDHDYADVKKALYPMLENGTISYDLLWALYKPNTIAYTTTYGDADQPRAFKIDFATKETHFAKGSWYSIEGKYLDYNGKDFGMATMDCDVDSFKGIRQITSLACYPLKYHKEPEKVKEQLIERGKKFVTLKGMSYKHHNGMAYMKKKRQVLRVCINGRVMVDSAIFRRINPNYTTGTLRPKSDDDEYFSESDDGASCCCSDEGSVDVDSNSQDGLDRESRPKRRYKLIFDKEGEAHIVEIEYDENGNEIRPAEKLGETVNEANDEGKMQFTDEELLMASPVVLGFAFQEKLWLEFSVSGIGEVQWNTGAFESLVLPANQKRIVKALVSSHKFHPSKNLDDIIAKKGLGCIMVLHGPPGTGKTLTAEGIAELLKAPLYMVSAGELGTDPRTLERELQNILDIAHSWGAILLLDEADVFMERRSLHDIHRNALVGIFLRLLEYFQGILFLTTNRVETFDDAFQSRIHVALRYGELDFHAKKSVWKMFISKIQAVVPADRVGKFDDDDFDRLARKSLNGRQIKNAARAAQALAVDEGKPLSMKHVEEVLRVAQSFEQDLKGGTGYEDAMRSYF